MLRFSLVLFGGLNGAELWKLKAGVITTPYQLVRPLGHTCRRREESPGSIGLVTVSKPGQIHHMSFENGCGKCSWLSEPWP